MHQLVLLSYTVESDLAVGPMQMKCGESMKETVMHVWR